MQSTVFKCQVIADSKKPEIKSTVKYLTHAAV